MPDENTVGPGSPGFRAGFAALVGRPNVGKSTLINALIGEKVSIVTSRPQTTRHRVLGVLNRPGVQLAFVDTPGLHLGERRALNRAMNRTAAAALADADLVVFVVEALRFGEEDEAVLRRIRDSGRDAIAVVNKVDKVNPRDKLLPFVADLAARHAFLDVVPVSAQKGDNLERLIGVIGARLPESPELFPPEQRTDRGIGVAVRSAQRLGDDAVDDPERLKVRGRNLHRLRGFRGLVRGPPEDRCAAFGRDDRVNGMFEHENAVGGGDGDRAAGPALPDDNRDQRDL